MPRGKRAAPKLYELHIELDGIAPPVWRRMLVPATIKLPKLHDLLQLVMGWTDSHLHSFRFGERVYTAANEEMGELEMLDEKNVTLESALGRARRFDYEYDFGDSWHHRLTVREVADPRPEWPYPLCIGGARAAPPEDVGGVPGYFEFLSAIADPTHEEHDRMLEWVGGAFDPEGFDLNAINRYLRYGRL
jgi:hypothetical protein